MKITIPFKTPTLNHLYWHRGNMKIMKREAKELREKINNIVSKINNDLNNDSKLKVLVEIYENWFNKDNTIKRIDVLNREKFLIDSIFNSIGIDDKNIFDCQFIKKQSNKEQSIITINTIEDNQL